MKIKFLFCFLLFLSGTQSSEPLFASEEKSGKILYYVRREEPMLVKLKLPAQEEFQLGSILHVKRAKGDALGSRSLVPMGSVKIVSLSAGGEATAQVLEKNSQYSLLIFPDYSDVMAGDLIEKPQLLIEHRQEVTPLVEFSYAQLFVDPSPKPETYELSAVGNKNLEEVDKIFSRLNFNRLLIKGYTDDNGLFEENQVESYQRAVTIRQYLIDRFHFAPEKLVAIGHGEDELKDNSHTFGAVSANRRVIIKIASSFELK